MKDITLDLNQDKLDFTVNFHFEKNDYFNEEVLFKTFIYDETTYEPYKAIASNINWKSGKNPGKKETTKRLKSK